MGTVQAKVEIAGSAQSYDLGQEQDNLADVNGKKIDVDNKLWGAGLDISGFARIQMGDSPVYLDLGAGFGMTGFQKESYAHMVNGDGNGQDNFVPVDPGVDCDFEPELCANNQEENGPTTGKKNTTTHMSLNRFGLSPQARVLYKLPIENQTLLAGIAGGATIGSFFSKGAAMTQSKGGFNNIAPTDLDNFMDFWVGLHAEYELPVELPVVSGLTVTASSKLFARGSATGYDAGVNEDANPFGPTKTFVPLMIGVGGVFGGGNGGSRVAEDDPCSDDNWGYDDSAQEIATWIDGWEVANRTALDAADYGDISYYFTKEKEKDGIKTSASVPDEVLSCPNKGVRYIILDDGSAEYKTNASDPTKGKAAKSISDIEAGL